ncbi:MAG TPA: HAD-IA family hydrolase [Elainellaceae cyanobacterium]
MKSSHHRPKVILLDAVGTLFGVQGSVGQIYHNIAKEFGVDADVQALNQAFFRSFRDAPPLAFPGVDPKEVPQREFDWWEAIARETFEQVGVVDQFTNFSEFFRSLYDYFATASPWFVYPETRYVLADWRSKGIELGVLSNFDSRIYAVLESLKLSNLLSSVTISSEVGVAKPDPKAFEMALKKHTCSPHDAWYVGDSFREDYEGAKAAGLRAIWLRRKG